MSQTNYIMAAKLNPTANKKEGEITRREVISATQQAASVLKNVKEKAGDVIHVSINDRTTIELPAHLTQDEIDIRVKRYMELRK